MSAFKVSKFLVKTIVAFYSDPRARKTFLNLGDIEFFSWKIFLLHRQKPTDLFRFGHGRPDLGERDPGRRLGQHVPAILLWDQAGSRWHVGGRRSLSFVRVANLLFGEKVFWAEGELRRAAGLPVRRRLPRQSRQKDAGLVQVLRTLEAEPLEAMMI